MSNAIGTLALACFVTGVIVGWLARTISASAQIALYQKQLQEKVRYWQCEAVYARDSAEHYVQLLAALTGQQPGPPDDPPGNDEDQQ